MNSSITIQNRTNYLKSVNPNLLIGYLIANGWSEIQKISDEIKILINIDEAGKKHKVWVPLLQNASDYGSMIINVIDTLCEVQHKTYRQVYEDLQTIAVGDVIRYRAFDNSNPEEHTILLNEGINIFNKIKQMASAAAANVNEKKAIHSRKPTTEVKKYLDSLRLGQTEEGSFLIKVISPISPIEKIEGEFDDFSEQIPFSRRAVIELFRGLNIINDVTKMEIKKGEFDFNLFLEAVPQGVSANLCEAILPTIEDVEYLKTTPIEISVVWSYLIQDKSLTSDSKIVIEKSSFPYIRKAAKEFRLRNPEIITLSGWVNILEKDSRNGPGNIRIIGKTPDGIKSVRVKLEKDDYDIAYGSYKKGTIVSVTGELIKDNNIFYLRDPKNMHLIAEDFLLDIQEEI